MSYSIRKFAFAFALAASAGSGLAQQQSYGRDSVYAKPTQATRQARVAPDTTAAGMAEVRFGRDSVYTTASSPPSTPVSAEATGLLRYGRSSVYATQIGNPQTPASETRIGQAPSSDHRAN